MDQPFPGLEFDAWVGVPLSDGAEGWEREGELVTDSLVDLAALPREQANVGQGGECGRG